MIALGSRPFVEAFVEAFSKSLKPDGVFAEVFDVQEMLEIGLEFESKAVKLYNEALALADDDRALVVLLEDILKEEQEGVDDLTKLLRDKIAAEGSASDARAQAG